MERNNINTNNTTDPYFEEVKSKTTFTFDFVLWFYRILKYWYLFAIFLGLCLSFAYILNRKWVPVYVTQALVILEERGDVSIVAGAVPLGSILRNTLNQQIVLESYGMTERTIKNMDKAKYPKMHVDYFRQTRFKRYSLYVNTPVLINIIEIKPQAYYQVFNLAYVDKNTCRIYYEGTEDKPGFSVNIPFNEDFKTKGFKIRLEKTEDFEGKFIDFSFRFLSDNDLIGMYNKSISTQLKDEKATALTISKYGTDAARDVDYMSSLLNEFRNYNLDLKNQQADLSLDFIEKQLNIISDSLKSSQLALEHFQNESGVFEATASKDIRGNMDEAFGEKDKLMIKENSMLILSTQIKSNLNGSTPLIEPSALDITEPKLEEYIQEYNKLLSGSQYYGPKNPFYKQTVDQLNTYRMKIGEELLRIFAKLQNEKENLVNKYEILELKVNNLPPQERELLKLEREYKINEIYDQFLRQRKHEVQIQKASNTPDNFVLEAPRSAGVVNSGETSKNYLYFFALGLILPIGIIILKEEVLKNKLSTKEECEKLSGRPVIGTIENVSKKLSNGSVLVKNYPKSSFAESFRNIRVRLEYMAQRENNISVLVTSAEPGDGKTFIATNIASVYQLTGKKVVIVDLGLRRPAVSKTLNLISHRGVSNYLINQVTLDEIIISKTDFGFDVIPAGTLPPNPSELIKTEKTKELINALKKTYDYVIIDCSPVGLVSDAYVLSAMVDTTLFVVRRNKTSKTFFKSVIDQLKIDGINNTALIFNDVKGREGYYGTARYYGDKSYYLKKSNYYHDDYFEKD